MALLIHPKTGAELRDCPTMLKEVEHCDLAMKYVRSWRRAIDGGAHRGLWSEALAGLFEHVDAFEPIKALADENRFATTVHRCALGAAPGHCAIGYGRDNNGQGHVLPGDDIEVAALDEFQFLDVDFLKLDVEGYELHALRGAAMTIMVSRPVIVLEQNGLSERYGYKDSDVDDWLRERGYRRAERWNKDSLFVCE